MQRQTLRALTTERVSDSSAELDRWPPLAIVTEMNRQDATVVRAVHGQLPQIAKAVELIAAQLARGGRLIYVGAGTSGRLGVLDASECPPTFGVPARMVRGVIAGGRRALVRSSEGVEDDARAGARDLQALHPTERDVVVGIAASGRTPYVIGALRAAQRAGAARIALVNTPHSAVGAQAQLVIAPLTGAEVLSGSTRLKAGTAQKMVLNMLSTGAFVRLGKVYRNLMVDVQASNSKLRARAVHILCTVTGMDERRARRVLARVDWQLKTAIVMELGAMSAREARARLRRTKGFVREALQSAGRAA